MSRNKNLDGLLRGFGKYEFIDIIKVNAFIAAKLYTFTFQILYKPSIEYSDISESLRNLRKPIKDLVTSILNGNWSFDKYSS